MKKILLTILLIIGITNAEATGSDGHYYVTIYIDANISTIDDSLNLLENKLQVGDTISGYYTYDLNKTDSNNAETVGDYRYTNPPNGIFLHANGIKFETNLDDIDFLVEMVNDHNGGGDNYLLRSYNNKKVNENLYTHHISWQLDDDTANAINSISLPINAPDLSKWQSIVGLTIMGGNNSEESHEDTFFIRAHVYSARVVTFADCYNDGKQFCIDNPNECGIKPTIVVVPL